MENARPRGNPTGRSAWGAPLCCGSSEMSRHRLLAPPRGASPGAGGAPEILGSPNPSAADRRQGGALSREANKVMRGPPPAPGRSPSWPCPMCEAASGRTLNGGNQRPAERRGAQEGGEAPFLMNGAPGRTRFAGPLRASLVSESARCVLSGPCQPGAGPTSVPAALRMLPLRSRSRGRVWAPPALLAPPGYSSGVGLRWRARQDSNLRPPA